MELLRRFRFTVLLMMLTTLVACGSGDGNLLGDVDGGTNEDVITITIQKVTEGDLSATNDIEIRATVLQGSNALSEKLVTFELSDPNLAIFASGNGSVATNQNGVALITLKATSEGGGVGIRASYDTESTDELAFTSAGDGNNSEAPTVASIGLFASTQQLASSGADEITLIAIVKDANNNLLEGITVSFQADSANIELINAVTESNGKASAKLTTENEPSNRVINIVAVSNSIEDTVSVQVVGTSVSLTGSSSLAINDDNSYIIKVLDSDGNGLANKIVNLSLSGESTEIPVGTVASVYIPETVTTDFEGQATFLAQGTSGGTNSIVANVLGATANQKISVQADSFLFTAFSDGNGNDVDPSEQPTPDIPDVFLSNIAKVELTWLRSGSPVANGTIINFTSTRGALSDENGVTVSSAITSSGKVAVFLTSNNAGKSLVTFTGVDGSIELNNQLEFEFVADTIETIKAQASPKSLGPNGDTSTISIVAKDSDGNLVKGKTIDFTLDDTTGGSIFPASAVTNSNGSASTVYTSGAISAQDGITITATVNEVTTKKDEVTLTVADRELFIQLGTGNSLEQYDSTSYNKKYSVFVTDADSNPVDNVTLTISANPKGYYKGSWVKILEDGEFKVWDANHASVLCENEDENLNGILDQGEDTNTDGVLTPGNVVIATGEVTTDEFGHAVIDIIYAESFGQWVEVNLIASARVAGTESEKQVTFTLPVLADDVNTEDVSPPTASIGLAGPFGSTSDCNSTD